MAHARPGTARVDAFLRRGRRSDGSVGVAIIHIDDLRQVRDTLGRNAGEELLNSVGRCLSREVRPPGTVDRLADGRFLVLVERADDSDVEELGARLVAAFAAPMELLGTHVFVTVSIGTSVGLADVTADELLRTADVALGRAEDAGTTTSARYRREMDDQDDAYPARACAIVTSSRTALRGLAPRS